MVRTPKFRIIANGKDVTDILIKYIISIEYTDDIDNEADGLTLRFHGESFNPPEFNDTLKVWLGFDDGLWYIGSFSVLKPRLDYDTMEVSVTATPVDFGSEIKEKRTTSYDNTTLDQILTQISGRHGLGIKNSFPKHSYTHKSQTDESDLTFMQRLASELGATFAIKNNTILFRPKKGGDQESELPAFTIDAKQTSGLWIEKLDKTYYKSVTAMWHSTKENHNKRVTVGSGKPALHIKGVFKDEADARIKAKAKLEAANRGMARGGFSIDGMNIISGAMIELENIPPKWPTSFGVQQCRHSWSSSGYTVDVEFEN